MPLVTSDLGEEAATSQENLITHAMSLSIRNGTRILKILHSSLDSPYRIADWHVVYMTFTAITSLLAIEKHIPDSGESFETTIEECRQIFRYMEPRVSISSRALKSLEIIRHKSPSNPEIQRMNILIPAGEQGIDSGLGGSGNFDSFDWLANPSALLSRQTPGFNMSWMTDSGDWIS
ncbi:hypothetical protein E4T44_06467 [Aureobasidium sp. EXF-8845]|nr:hypothetical protein E4T44_06467 [Aureobasidium sp. EXF-8845]KAI4846446.1 hypothetical protein E4T45_07243 [Aureobasidium sp. EXF-8846]